MTESMRKDRTYWQETVRMFSNRDFMIGWLYPFVVGFFSTLLFFTYLFNQAPIFCVSWSIIIFVTSFGLACARANRLFFQLGITTMLAVLVGTVLGLYDYSNFSIYPLLYSRSREYTNVVPSQAASAVQDAGYIVFTEEARVDISRSVSLTSELGTKYCVAPVVDNSAVTSINFWAAGTGCCNEEGDFNCDGVASTNHAGTVLFDIPNWFHNTRFDFYRKARTKAEARYGLSSVTDAHFVRYCAAKDLYVLMYYYRMVAIIFWVVTSLAYLFLSAAIAYAFVSGAAPMMRKRA